MFLFVEIFLFVVHMLSWAAVCHALLTKTDPRSALGWSAITLLVPALGLILYVLFGISRTQSRASKIMREVASREPDYAHPVLSPKIPENIPASLMEMEKLGRYLTQEHLSGGNLLTPLINGNEAYPNMLDAIRASTSHVFLVTYIFNRGHVGTAFTNALCAAAERGVDVRVIVDGVGRFYALKFPLEKLKRSGVRVCFFLPPRLFPPNLTINLRNHRKVLVCDGTAYTGGMNIADYHVLNHKTGEGVQDVHFRCEGPIVNQLCRAFLLDWGFTSGTYDRYLPKPVESRPGTSLCRLILDGPGTKADPLNGLLAGVICCARHKIRIMTPYFLPTREIMAALRFASEKGVDVRIILPEKNNLPYIHWAMQRIFPTLIAAGVHIYYQPAPFSHTKLLTIDNEYIQIGSANFDSRSLRLNFELNTEVIDRKLNRIVTGYIEDKINVSHEIKSTELNQLNILQKLRNAAFWIFSPYL